MVGGNVGNGGECCSRTAAITAWLLVVLWAAFIFLMSAHTGTDLDSGSGLAAQVKRWLSALAAPVFGEGTDVVSVGAHFLEYAVFGALLFVAILLTCQYRAQRAVCDPRPGIGMSPCTLRSDAGCDPHTDEAAVSLPTRDGGATDRGFGGNRLWLLMLAAVVIASLYGASDELHQLFVPGRLCDPADWLTDTCGAALGAAVAALLAR